MTGVRRYGRVYLAPSRIHGEGVFAADDIAAGERIFAVDDSNVVPEGADMEEVERAHRHHCDDIARRTIHSDFFHLPLARQIEYLPLLDDWFVEENRERVKTLGSQIARRFTEA